MPAGLVFQTITILRDSSDDWSPQNWRVPPGLEVRLSAPSPTAMPKHPLSLRLNQELEVVAMRIRQMMQARGGVLLTVSIQEKRPTAPEEEILYKFNWVNVDRPGPVPE